LPRRTPAGDGRLGDTFWIVACSMPPRPAHRLWLDLAASSPQRRLDPLPTQFPREWCIVPRRGFGRDHRTPGLRGQEQTHESGGNDMRKTLLAAVVALAIPALYAPAASADETFQGTCQITGVATFDIPLTTNPIADTFHFKSSSPDGGTTPNGTKCSGTLDGQSISPANPLLAVAVVDGPGQLSCTRSTGSGSGYLAFPSTGSIFPFAGSGGNPGFSFKGAGTEVQFTVAYDGGSANGHASFAKYASSALNNCNDPSKGVSSLGFEAQVAILQTVHGYNNNAPPSNVSKYYNSTGAGSTGGTGKTPTGTQRTGKVSPCSNLKGSKRTACLKRQACLKKKGSARAKCLAKLNKAGKKGKGKKH
jgi:hypothetical protein